MHVVNVEPVALSTATGTTPTVASQRRTAHTLPLVRIVGPIRETHAARHSLLGGVVLGVLAHRILRPIGPLQGFHVTYKRA